MDPKHLKISDERKQFLHDIMTTAVEGGINYWAEISDTDDPDTYHLVERDESDDPFDSTEANDFDLIDLNTIELGIYRTLHHSPALSIRQDIRDAIAKAVVNDLDASQIDAEAADVIVQVGLFARVEFS